MIDMVRTFLNANIILVKAWIWSGCGHDEFQSLRQLAKVVVSCAFDQHGVAIAEKAVALGNGVAISVLNVIEPGEGGYQHQ